MIKKAKKSVAVGLSVALAVTSVNIPVNSASAAAKKAKLSATKKTLTAGKSTTLTLKTNKKKAKTIKTIKAKYVKVSTSKKSVATVKKVSKKSKVTGIKVTAKKAGTATITVKVTKGTYKGTYKCKVTVKKKASATKKPTQKPTEVPTATPEVTVEPTVEPTTTPAITAEPSTTPAITATPATKVTVVNTSIITKSDDTFTVTLTLDGTYTNEQLKGAKVTLTNSAANITTTATFSKIDVDGKAVFTVDDTKVLTPGNTTANGYYKVSSDSQALVISGDVVASYEESLAGNKIKGYVLTDKKVNNDYDGVFKNGVQGATVTVEGGQSTTTDAEGYYELPSVAGKKIVTVSKDGFVTKYFTGSKRVYVNKSHVTSQNVVLEHFDVRKLTVNVKAIDKDAKTGISGAKVVLKNSAGTVVKEGTADANGQITFGNDKHVSSAVGTNLISPELNKNYLSQGTYTLEVSKKLSQSNVSDVYATFTKSFKIENDYTYTETVEGTKTAAVKSFKVTQNLKEKAEKAYVNSSSRINVKYALYTLVDGNAVSAPIIENTAAVESDAITSAKTLTSNILSALIATASTKDTVLAAASNKALTLPTGDYYLLLTPELASGATGYTFAYNAVKVSVTAGGDVTATADLTEGNVRTINTQVTLPNKVAGDDVQTDKKGLFTVKWDATTKKFVLADEAAPFNKEQVKASYAISQVVAGTDDKVAIKIPENGNFTTPEYKKGADGAYASSVKYVNFLGTGKYIIESTGDYTTSVAKQTEQINNDKGSVNFKVAGAANVVKVTVKAVAGSDVIGKNTFGKLTKLVAYDSTGKAVATKDYTATTAADKQVKGQDLLASGSAITGSAIAVNDYAEYNTQTGNYTMNLPEGKYTFGVTLAGYKEVVSDAVDVNAIEKVGITISKKLEKATADATTISGEVRVLNENKIGYVDLDDTTIGKKLTNGTVVLLTADKKIAAVDMLNWDATKNVYTYSFFDGETDGSGMNVIKPGTYTMVVRTSETETLVSTVTVADGEKKAWNVELVKGAYGQIKAFALDNYNKVLKDTNAVAVAYDEYFVDPSVASNYVKGVVANSASTAYAGTIGTTYTEKARFGAYLTTSKRATDGSYSYTESNNQVKQDGYYVFDYLPAGTYKVNLGVKLDSTKKSPYVWKEETATLKDSGDVVKAEYTYNRTGEEGNDILVPLTINLKGVLSANSSLDKPTPYVVIITPTKGAGTKTYKVVATQAGDLEKIMVAGKTNYDVTVYTYDGYQLASNAINVERSAATVEVALNASDMD